VLVYFGAIAGALVIRRAGLRGRMARIGSGLLLAGILVALTGDVAAYWSRGTVFPIALAIAGAAWLLIRQAARPGIVPAEADLA
jgi:hypothetical protein